MKITELLENYKEHSRRYKKTSTHSYDLKELRALERALNTLKVHTLSAFTVNSMDLYIDYFKKHTERKNSSINKSITFLFTVFNHFEIFLPFRKRLLPDDTINTKPLFTDDIKKVIQYTFNLDHEKAGNHLFYKLSIALMLETGIRIGELYHLKNGNVDIAKKVVYLDETKNGKPRAMPFGELTNLYINVAIDDARKRGDNYLFWNKVRNQKPTQKVFNAYVNRLKRNLSIDVISARMFRKTYAVMLQHNNCPLEVIQELLGHSDLSMTKVYLDNTKHYTIMTAKKYETNYLAFIN